MNIENEKKWFVYVGDHHEGPFSAEEVSEKKSAGAVSDQSYVWAEGMADWVMLSDAKDLTGEIKKAEANANASPEPAPQKTTPEPTQAQAQAYKAKTSTSKIKIAKKSRAPLFITLALLLIVGAVIASPILISRYASEDLHSKVRPKINALVTKVPALRPLFHLVPTLTDVTPEEQLELEQATSGPADAGPKISLALSQADSNRPFFYVATNLPNHTKFDVYLVGNSETLLNKLQYSAQNSATTNNGFGRTEVFMADGGQLIPKGDYRVVITESVDQDESVKTTLAALPPTKTSLKLPENIPPNAHFVVMKTYFLGGPRDETYLTRLKQFHEKIKQNSEREVQELKQYSDTLNLQFSTLTTEFNRIYTAKKVPAGMKAAWKKDADTWQQINGQLEQTIQTWSKETIQNEFFYGKVYALVKSAYDSIKALFVLENSFVETPVDHATFDVQHGKNLSETRDALELLRTKMDVILNAPKTPSGLPTRDGL